MPCPVGGHHQIRIVANPAAPLGAGVSLPSRLSVRSEQAANEEVL